ncbi:hypothetical protein HYPSUDRAFT_68773 [Hypholoma sublateritium FD-334 SS-4]|uniref:Uncharacterized protein n=1 Tax=Hypholoma sublateritium (strain FD-334 SS-4) TaxID=945553 RepID=A0A0D2NTU6_HYPSF|nr:hypothetical protein HYPSUDRAFT_68773 [Hypholoma sublateritium FD-334 SS-4]
MLTKAIDLRVDAPFAFAPAPPYKYRAVLLSCTRCYWLALVGALDEDGKKQLALRLGAVPPYGERVPAFNGARCVAQAGALTAGEYEGLMRVVAYVAIGLAADDVAGMWRELATVGVQTWQDLGGERLDCGFREL